MKTTGKPSWRTAPPNWRERWEGWLADGLLCKAQYAAYEQGYDFTPDDVLESFSNATRELARVEADQSIPGWRKHGIRGPLLARSQEEARMLRFATRPDVVAWRAQPWVDPAEVQRAAGEREKAARAEFIERRTAEILKAENDARVARARGQAENEYERARKV